MRTIGNMRSFGRRAGLSLIEVVIGSGLLGGVFALGGMVLSQGQGAYQAVVSESELEGRAELLGERLVGELRGVSAAVLLPDPGALGADTVSYQVPVGVVGGAVQWGPLCRLELEYDVGELDDGVDNDGDGLVDECALVLTRNPGEANEIRTVLCDSVTEHLEGEVLNAQDDNGNGLDDEKGFSLQHVDDLLVIRLSMACMGEEGPHVRTIETTLELRD